MDLKSANLICAIFCMCFEASIAFGQPNADFSIQSEYCSKETILLANNSTSAVSYQWYFCPPSIGSGTEIFENSISSSSAKSNATAIAKDTSVVVFYANGSLRKASYSNNSFDGPVSLAAISGSSGSFSGQMDFALTKDNGKWYGFTPNNSTSVGLSRSFFGDKIGDALEEYDFIEGISPIYSTQSIEVINDNAVKYVVAGKSGGGELVFVNLSNGFGSVATSTSSFTVSGASGIHGITHRKTNTGWELYVITDTNNRVYIVSLDETFSNPSSSAFTATGYTPNSASEIELMEENGVEHLVILNSAGDLDILSYENGLWVFKRTVESSEVGFSTLNSTVAEDSTVLIGSSTTGAYSGLNRIYFESECSASISFSSEENPTVHYTEASTPTITLVAYDLNGKVDKVTKSPTITSSKAPNISFSIDESRCLDNVNSFISIDDGDIATYSWDFDGDGVEDSSDPNPTYQFTAPGSYTIQLSVVSSGSCANVVSQEISIYNAPSMPDFEYSPTVLCSNFDITFTNLTNENGAGDTVSYLWDFDGEAISIERDPVYAFASPGIKAVSLTAAIPGCTTNIYSEDIEIIEGPAVDFSYANNCFGEAIQFTDATIGTNIDSYSWDFGDGVGNSDQQNPSYKYATEGAYEVVLTVTNLSGCETSNSQIITASDAAKTDFIYGSAVENLPVSFSGEDLTLADDEVVSWSWDFGGLGISDQQHTDFTFNEPGDYLVSLTVGTAQGCSETTSQFVTVSGSLQPTGDFIVPTSACINESIVLQNQSINADSYSWFFCPSSIGYGAPVIENSSSSSTALSNATAIAPDTSVVIFYASGSLRKASYADGSFSGPVTLTAISGSSGSFSGQEDFALVKDNGEWYGFTPNNSGSVGLSRSYFGKEIGSALERYDFIEGISPVYSTRSIEIINQSGIKYIVAGKASGGELVFVNFDNGFGQAATSTYTYIVPGASGIHGIAHRKTNTGWELYVITDSGSKVYAVSLDEDFLNPSSSAFSASGYTANSPSEIELVEDSGLEYLVLLNNDDDLTIIEYQNDSWALKRTVEATNVGLGTLNSAVVQDSTILIGSSTTGAYSGLNRIYFKSSCIASVRTSDEGSPTVYYTDALPPMITLIAYDQDGKADKVSKSLTISSSVAPDIGFNIDDSRCITNPTTFTSFNTSGDITSYSWDFNGDGIEDSTDPNPTFQYNTPGTYDVRLDVVSDEGCSNHVKEQITLYPEPPVPSFDIAGTLCNGMEIVFANTTDETGFEEALSYSWDFNGEGVSSQEDTVFTFNESGSKTIILTASIPGCSTTTTRVIELKTGPQVDFSWSENCFGDIIQFQNLTSGSDVTAYSWDFGDGYTSTEAEPEHVYAQTGTYELVLTAYNEAGCSGTLSKEITIEAIPSPYFEYGLACEGQELVLQDMSEVENSQIIAWEWYVDDAAEPVSEEPNAEVLLESSDGEIIRLVVYAANGCEASYSRSVDVREIPSVSFSSEIGCIGEVSGFEDKTPDPDRMASRSWFVNGQLIHAETSAQFDTVFAEPGTYEVELVVNNQNFCSGSYKDTVEILALPTLAFEVLGECKGEPISVRDISGSAADSLVSRTWYLDGKQVGNGTEAFLPVTESGNYEVMLSANTNKGCNITLTKRIDIFPKPVADFTASNDYGVPPFHISFENQSENASYYQWFLDGEQVSTEENVTLSFTDEGIKKIKLIAQNDQGCTDSLSFAINSAVPVVDIVLNKIQLIQDDNGHGVLLDISNKSNIPVEHLQAKITLENDFEVTETISQRIGVNQQAVERLNMSFPVGAGNLSYLCVTLFSPYQEEDQTPADNENCINVESKAIIEAPFPNPSVGRTTVRAVLPAAGDVDLMIVDMTGQVRLLEQLPSRPKGLNTFVIDLLKLDAGTYFLTIDFKGKTYKTRIIKQ